MKTYFHNSNEQLLVESIFTSVVTWEIWWKAFMSQCTVGTQWMALLRESFAKGRELKNTIYKLKRLSPSQKH